MKWYEYFCNILTSQGRTKSLDSVTELHRIQQRASLGFLQVQIQTPATQEAGIHFNFNWRRILLDKLSSDIYIYLSLGFALQARVSGTSSEVSVAGSTEQARVVTMWRGTKQVGTESLRMAARYLSEEFELKLHVFFQQAAASCLLPSLHSTSPHHRPALQQSDRAPFDLRIGIWKKYKGYHAAGSKPPAVM